MVMYAGKVVEHASCDQIFDKSMHPYTDGLMKCIPKLDDDDTKELSVIKGMVPSLMICRQVRVLPEMSAGPRDLPSEDAGVSRGRGPQSALL